MLLVSMAQQEVFCARSLAHVALLGLSVLLTNMVFYLWGAFEKQQDYATHSVKPRDFFNITNQLL